MFLIVENSEAAKALLPIYVLTVGTDFAQPHVRRPNGAPLHQIFFVERGSLRLSVNGETLVLEEGTAVFMKKGQSVFYERASAEGRTGWVAFDGEGVERLLHYFRAAPISYQSGALLRELHRTCVREADRKAPPEALSGLAYEMLLAYFRALNGAKESSKLATAKAYIAGHFATDLSVADVARTTGVSESLLFRLFRREEGSTPVVYLRGVRLQNAKRLLLEAPKMPISEIATACGFADTAYFCKVFRDREGMTPNGYRKLYMS